MRILLKIIVVCVFFVLLCAVAPAGSRRPHVYCRDQPLLPEGLSIMDQDQRIYPSPFPDWFATPGYFQRRMDLRQDERPEGLQSSRPPNGDGIGRGA